MEITKLLHKITQLGYEVQFCGDFEGMIRIEFRKEFDEDFYEHEHLSFPSGTMLQLNEKIQGALYEFYEKATK